MNTRIPILSLLVSLCSIPCLAAEDATDTQALYDQHCVSCHGTEVYTRDDRKVGSLAALQTQVRRCETALELRWFDEDIDAVTQLLNDRFYHFKAGG